MDSGSPYLGVIIHKFLDGDDSTIAFLARLVKSPRRDEVNGAGLNISLSPRLRANPRMQDIMVELGYPRPRAQEATR